MIILSKIKPNPIKQPNPARHHIRIAVVTFAILSISFLNTRPAPINPTPDTTCATTLAGSPPILVDINENINAPSIVSVTERTPIIP